MRWLLIFKGIFWLSANGRSRLKVNISPLPVTDILEIRLKCLKRIETGFSEATTMHSKNQGKKLTDMLLKKVTLQVRRKTHSNN